MIRQRMPRLLRGAIAPVALTVLLGSAWCNPDLATRSRPVHRVASDPPRRDSLGVTDLPLVDVPSKRPGTAMAVLLTGDGGWAAADRAMADALAARGVSVVGLDSRGYLMHGQTLESLGADLQRILRHYLAAWRRPQVFIVGYSRGAELAPFMVTRLPDDLRRHVAALALLGPSERTSFRFHWVDLVLSAPRGADVPVRPELEKLRGTPIVCIYGRKDHDAICPALDPGLARPVARDGSHRVSPAEADWVATTVIEASISGRDVPRNGPL
jgi:type IV secretory pathway VirJ component